MDGSWSAHGVHGNVWGVKYFRMANLTYILLPYNIPSPQMLSLICVMTELAFYLACMYSNTPLPCSVISLSLLFLGFFAKRISGQKATAFKLLPVRWIQQTHILNVFVNKKYLIC